MTSSHSKSILVLLSFAVVVLLAVVVLGTYIVRSKNRQASESLNQAISITEMETLTHFVEMVQTDAAPDLLALDNLILSSDKLISLIENIEEAGKVFKLDTNILSVEKVANQNSEGPQLFRIAVETKGEWSGTFAFLKTVESLPQRVNIDEAWLSKDATTWYSRVALVLYAFD